jgi:superfamily II DNA/RNA helicase
MSFPTEDYNLITSIVKYETEDERNFYIAAAGSLAEKLKVLLEGYEKLESEDSILLLFTLLRLLSSHPASFIKSYNKRYKEPIPMWNGTVSKLNMIEAQLSNYQSNGESCIVFCHYYEECTRISELNHGYTNVEYINGTVCMEDRDYVVNDSKQVISEGGTYLIIANIISCGEGLNLQHFNNVIIATPDWNPQAEEQAIARVYRIGSRKRVNVTKYYHEAIHELHDTLNIDKYMKNKQDIKRKLALEVIDQTPNAAWKYPVTNIPGTNEPSVTFPVIVPTRVPITKPPKARKKPVKVATKPRANARR